MTRHGGGGPGPGPTGGRRDDRGGRPGGAGGRDANETIAQRWPDYLTDGYFGPDGSLKIEYVSREKVEPLAQSMSSLTIHQVRRFFGHCRAIETRLKSGGATWASLWPEVKKLDIAAADAAAKQPPKIPGLFHDFIRRNIDKIRNEKDFLRGFLPHFEALVGFGQAYFRKDRS